MKNKKLTYFSLVFFVLLLGIMTPLFYPSLNLKAYQDSYIEVYVFDSVTLEPIAGAYITLYDEYYYVYLYVTTDSNGFANFTNLLPSIYYINLVALGYYDNTTTVTIDFDGEYEIVEFFQLMAYTPGNGFIEGYVYDSNTLNPILNAGVELYTYEWDDINSTYVQEDGFYNFTGLGANDYWLLAYASNYETMQIMITIHYDGEAVSYEFYLEPIYIPGDSYIEVYVFALETLLPIPFAYIQLYNENYYSITSDFADSEGFYNFTGLGAGIYVLYIDYPDFASKYYTVTIDYDGEGEYLEAYLPPGFMPGTGYIEVSVYDNNTLAPIELADVRLYDEYDIFISSGYTDYDGFCNFTDLPVRGYRIEAEASGYTLNETTVTIDIEGEGKYVELYLPPIVHAFEILSPSDSQIVEGGLVHFNCEANDINNLDYIDVFVNSIFITTFTIGGQSYHDEFFIPVFNNGTNIISFEVYWMDMTYVYTLVEINSINVIPIVQVKEGDIMNYLYELLGSNQKANYNFTFVEWLSPFELNTSVILHMYDDSGTIMYLEYYITINVLNGYVSEDPSLAFLYNRFFGFGSLLPNPQIDDKTAMVMLFELLTVTGSELWEYTEVWTLQYMGVSSIFYVEKGTNVVYYFGILGQVQVTLLETTIDFLAPTVNNVNDFEYTEGQTGNTISWLATDMNPYNYSIYKDTELLVDSAFWEAEEPLIINVDGLSAGSYIFKIIVQDLAGNIAEDFVIVTVNPVIPELIRIHYYAIFPVLACITLAFTLRKKLQVNT